MSQIVSMLRNYWLLTAFTLALILIFTGSALAASNRLPTFQLSNFPTFQPSNLLPSTEGARLFKQWCSACHGDKGQGLTAEWRAEWPEGKQNCWQSKCHAANHPPDGFSIPKKVPAVIGPGTLTKFNTAYDLYIYNQALMPYWAPNLLEDHEYLAITAFLVEANYGVRSVPLPVNSIDDLTAISLHPQLQTISQSSTEIIAPVGQTPYSLLPTPYFLFPCLSSGCPPKP